MAKAPRVTIQDVAVLSELSIRTVSRAVRHLLNVSDEAQAKVEVFAGLSQPVAGRGVFAANLQSERLHRPEQHSPRRPPLSERTSAP